MRFGALFVVATVALIAQGTPPPPPTVIPPTPPATRPIGTTKPVPPRTPPTGPGEQRYASTASVQGQIVDDAGRAVPTVAVRLLGARSMQTVVSDARGRFAFAGIAAGEYVVVARKHGFYDGAFGKRRAGGDPLPFALTPGQAFPDMRIELFRSGVITGTIVDEAHEPVIGARVVALRRRFVEGDWQFTHAGSDTTDDLGFYRVHSLEPGEYLISTPTSQFAAGSGLLERVVLPELPLADREDLAYPTVFYPATMHALLALAVRVGPGEVRQAIDFRWSPVPARTVRGQLTGPREAIANQVVKLLPVESRDLALGNDAAIALSDDVGAFVMERVPTGEYRIEAGTGYTSAAANLLDLPVIDGAAPLPGVYWGRAEVVVTDEDVGGIVVEMRSGLSISGRIRAGAAGAQADPAFARIPITLVPATPGASRVTTPRVAADGAFSAANLIPGDYLVRVGTLPPGWYLQSITGDGQDLLDAPIHLTSEDIANVRIALTTQPTEILGAVRDARMQPASGAAIIAMPANASRWSPNRTRQTRASTNGQFALAGLPAGEYLVVAVDDASAEGWQDASVLAQLRTLATRITLREGEMRTLLLRVSVLKR